MRDTIGDWWRSGTQYLEKVGIEGAERDVALILARHVQMDAGMVRIKADAPLPLICQSVGFKRSFWEDIWAREAGQPVSKIIGRRAFWKAEFYVTNAVLDPRPETETLIEAALALGPQDRVLDLGTGSGAIAISLATEWPRADVVATDVSTQALKVAAQNGRDIGVSDRVILVESDWFETVGGRFDLIVSNPPYIALDEMSGLSREVAQYDPRIALTDEGDGVSYYRTITAGAGDHLTPGGWLMVEIGPTQGAAVVAMFEAEGLTDVGIRHDLDGRDRVVVGQNVGQKPL